MLDEITLSGLSVHAFHGVYPEEKSQGQPFIADISYRFDSRSAARGDDLDETVSYAEVAQTVANCLTRGSFDLIETVAENTARVVLAFQPVAEVTVTIHKPQAPMPVPVSDISLTITRTRASLIPVGVREVVIGLGGNLGDVAEQFRAAIRILRTTLGEVEVAPLVRSAAVLASGQVPQPDYLNTVIIGKTRLAATELLELTRRVEDQLGRVRTERWGQRTIDLDIIDLARFCSEDPVLTIPHPRAAIRGFVLAPYAALRPDAVLSGRPVVELLAGLPDTSVGPLIQDWL